MKGERKGHHREGDSDQGKAKNILSNDFIYSLGMDKTSPWVLPLCLLFNSLQKQLHLLDTSQEQGSTSLFKEHQANPTLWTAPLVALACVLRGAVAK